MIKAVFLDIDNTLLDFDAYVKESMKKGFEQFQLCPYEDWMYEVFKKINNELWEEIERGTLTFRQLMQIRWNTVFQKLGITFDGCRFETYFREQLFDSAILVEGAEELLQYLSGRYLLCAASNGPYEQQVNRLRLAGLLPYFSHLFLSEKIGASKPSKAFFDHCIGEVNAHQRAAGAEELLPEELLMIGDSLTSDMTGGVENGWKTCFFDRKNTGETRGMAIDFRVTQLKELRNIL